jgi:protein dithiol oxidoreductase (disulfide-forming)
MKRREFSSWMVGAAGASVAWGSSAWAQPKPPVAGTDYYLVEPRAPVEAPAGRIEVVEFFWYNCVHCNAFEPTLEAWVKKLPKDVAFRRVPVAFRAEFAPQQRLFGALESMGLIEKLHPKVFVAIHVEKRKLDKGEAIVEWIGQQGVDKAKFLEHYNSFGVVTKVNKWTQLQNAYKIEGVPSLGVAGRFYTDGTLAKGMPRALQVVDALVASIRAGK